MTAPALSDSDILAAFEAAHIPVRYRAKGTGLQTLQNAEVREWATRWLASGEPRTMASLGKGIEIDSSAKAACDFLYLLARGMVLQGFIVKVWSMARLVSVVSRRFEEDGAAAMEELRTGGWLFVTDAFGAGPCPYSLREMVDVEWLLRSHLLTNYPLVLQGGGGFAACEWWSLSFRAIASESLSVAVHPPADDPPPRQVVGVKGRSSSKPVPSVRVEGPGTFA